MHAVNITPVPASSLTTIAWAAGLGLFLGLSLFVLRRFSVVQRLRASILGAALAWGIYFVLIGLAEPASATFIKVTLTAAWLFSVNIAVQLFDMVAWDLIANRAGRAMIPRLLIEIFKVAVLIAALLVILNRVFAVELSALLVTSTVLSAVLGLALQDILGNLIAGIALQLDRPFAIGDWIEVGANQGEVIRMNWRTMTLRNIDNQSITVANTNMARQDITNYSRPTRDQRMHVRVGLPYGTPPGVIKRVLLPALQSAEGVQRLPLPDVLVQEYGDSAVYYDLRYWISDYGRWPEIQDAVLSQVWYALRREGISVPFPVRDINLREITEEAERNLQARQQRERFDHLRPLPIFAPLVDDQIDRLAAASTLHLYHAGEVLVGQGDEGDSLFVVKAGRARVELVSPNGSRSLLAVRQPGEFFGEMSLLTGERRSASVIAESEMEVVVVDRSALADVLRGDFSSLEALSAIVAERLQMSRDLMAAGSELEETEGDRQSSLLLRIARFLGLEKT